MLVSSIARFDALNTLNSTNFASVQTSENMMRMAQGGASFGGEYGLNAFNEIDKRASFKFATNSLLHKLAYYHEQMLRDLQADEIKKYKVNYVA